MLLTRSFWRKVVATIGAAVGFVFVYETSIPDSWSSRGSASVDATAAPKPGARLPFTATAYCKGETTASGVSVRTGIAAADPALLPVGTVVRVDTPDSKLDGIWTVMDTGPSVQGRTIDLYLWSCHEALRFGRQPIQLEVLRLGWHPQNSEPSRAQTLFRQRERQRAAPASTPQPPAPTTTDVAPAAAPVVSAPPPSVL
jgi:3D (Asp-Asp-Asp) domain-containing protein